MHCTPNVCSRSYMFLPTSPSTKVAWPGMIYRGAICLNTVIVSLRSLCWILFGKVWFSNLLLYLVVMMQLCFIGSNSFRHAAIYVRKMRYIRRCCICFGKVRGFARLFACIISYHFVIGVSMVLLEGQKTPCQLIWQGVFCFINWFETTFFSVTRLKKHHQRTLRWACRNNLC